MASDLLRIRHEYSEESEQRQFFLNNLSQQFRSYYIAKGSSTAQYYDHWETPDSEKYTKALLIDPDISAPNAQTNYFEDNDDEILKGYYIAQKATSVGVLSYFSTPVFELIIDYSSVDTDSSLIPHIIEAKNIVESIILRTPYSQSPITITESVMNEPQNVLGSADWNNRTIVINSLNVNINAQYSLNNIPKNINILVLVHEIIHILGVGTDPAWTSNINNFFYTGENGLREYKQLLYDAGYDINGISGVPVENHFGSGTQYSHFEEGLFENMTLETRRDSNNVLHPTIPTEIMTGFLDDDNGSVNGNYITRMTLGILEDIGYVVDYESEHCVNTTTYQL
ncbi:MAG: hypothetical protein Ct9H90mP28_2210 [Paracoccaceae bacterium]|nr:MAG: hypothetical protein Ct9H90mP28_2210 [Paracoccaceae bacterium]